MGLLPRQVRVPEQEVGPTKVPFQNLAAVASHEDGANLNFTYEFRSDAGGINVYVKKREGITILSSLSGASAAVGRGIYAWRRSSATSDSIITAMDVGGTCTLYVDVSGTLTTTTKTMTTAREIYFVPVSSFDGSTTVESLFVFDGAGIVKIWDGASATTNWTNAASTPLQSAQYGVFYRNMLVSARTSDNKNRVFFSDVGKPDTFTTGNSLDFPAEITGLHVYENMVLVFTQNNIYVIQGAQPNDIVVSGSQRGLLQKGVATGSDSMRSIQRVGEWVYFWNRDRVFRTNTNDTQEVAYPKFLKTLGSIVKSSSSQFAGASFNGRYYLALPYSSGTTNNAVAVYDPRPDAEGRPIDEWVLHTAPWVHAFTTYRATASAVPTLIFDTNATTSRIEKVYTYNGSILPLDNQAAATTVAVTCQYTSQFLDFGDSHYIKKFRYLFFKTKGINVSAMAKLQVALDSGGFTDVYSLTMTSGGFTLDSSLLDVDALTDTADSLVDVKKIALPSGRTVAVRFYDAQVLGQSEFYDFDIQFIPKKLKTK